MEARGVGAKLDIYSKWTSDLTLTSLICILVPSQRLEKCIQGVWAEAKQLKNFKRMIVLMLL